MLMKSRRHSSTVHRGFTLVEVMVALIIIAIGALGIAKMQALALSSTSASRSRALAALEATSLAAAMHGNRSFWSSTGSLPGAIAITTSGGGAPSIVSSSATMQAAINAVSASQCPTGTTMKATLSCYCATGYSAPCSSAYINVAASDIYDWASTLASVLPSATANVTCDNATVVAGAPIDCIVSITWVENAVSLTQQEASAVSANGNTSSTNTAAFQYVSYTLDVVP